MHQSVATIDSPEFINLQPIDINPLMSSCEIKVLYIGENRNRSFITKEVAAEMAKTLRGAPIVGYYKDSKEDFADHGEKVTFDDEGVHFECMTKPYGFVAPNAKVWFQNFEEEDDFGNSITREYLMTTGYLWTGQFEECNSVIESGRPQSMELDEKTLNGNWSTNIKNGIDFFIINDAIFSKLCILGEDVEPCFEGASVTAPVVSSSYSLNDEFKNTLFTMMQDLKQVVSEGGQQMDNLETKTEEIVEQEVVTETEFTAESEEEVKVEETFTAEEVVEEEVPVEETQFEAQEEAEEAASEYKKEEEEEDSESEEESDEKKKDEDEEDYSCHDDEDKKKYELLESEFETLQEKYSALEAKYNELVEFKAGIENAKKDELIDSFSMLSEEEKKDVIDNKLTYSYDEIEAKLSILFARKSKEAKEEANEEEVITTFNFATTDSGLPAWLKAVRAVEDEMNS